MEDSTAVFEKYQTMLDNKVCFDCGAEKPTMAALLYGAFICDDCADIHLTFDSSISVVRPVYFDDWPAKKLAMMLIGGNMRARDFFEQHGWTGGGDLEAKYTSEAATLYRTFLLEKLEGLSVLSCPSESSHATDELPDSNVTEDIKECTLEDKNPETSPAISSADQFGRGVNEPPPIRSVQNMIEQVSFQETDEARRRFPNAKSISSAQFFGDQEKMDDEAKLCLQKFANATSISSADLLGARVKNHHLWMQESEDQRQSR